MRKETLEFDDHYKPLYKTYRAIYKRILTKTLDELGVKHGNFLVEVSIIDEESIQSINRDYRGKDSVTDVISFAFDDEVSGEVSVIDAPLRHLGSILICAPKAKSQALEYGHTEQREFKFLFVHGLLHLLGYDHDTPTKEEAMFTLQDKIIGKRGLNK